MIGRIEGIGPVLNIFLAVAISSVTFMAAALTPIVGPFVQLIVPLPVFYYSHRLGRLKGIAVFFLSVALVSAICNLYGFEVNFVMFAALGLFGFVLSETVKKNLSIERTVFHAILTVVIMAILFLVYLLKTTDINILTLTEAYIQKGVEESISVYAQLGMSAEQLNNLRDKAPHVVMIIIGLLPALMVVTGGSFVLVNIFLARELCKRTGLTFPDFGDLTRWKIPDQLIWFVIAAGISILLPWDHVRLIGLNFSILFMYVYLLQGLAISGYFFQKKRVHYAVRVVIYFLIFIQNFLLLVVVAIGVADVWMDFRKLNPKIADSVKTSSLEK